MRRHGSKFQKHKIYSNSTEVNIAIAFLRQELTSSAYFSPTFPFRELFYRLTMTRVGTTSEAANPTTVSEMKTITGYEVVTNNYSASCNRDPTPDMYICGEPPGTENRL